MSKRKSTSHVPEQYRGFSLQATRMAQLLLESPEGTSVSLELLDDVAVHSPSDGDLAVQTKDPAVSNPVQDRSVQLWKTFANWTRDAREGRLDPSRTKFELYVSKKVTGKLVRLLHDADSQTKAKSAFEQARNALWGISPNFAKRNAVAATLKPHLEEVFSAGAASFKTIIERFKLTCAAKNPESDLHKALTHPGHSEQITNDLMAFVQGWLKIQIDEALRERRAPVVARDEFIRQLKGAFNRLVPNGSLPDIATNPNPHELSNLMGRKFVRQMDIVGWDDMAKIRSITCYFKAVAVRTAWAKAGQALVDDASISEFEDDLCQLWRSHRLEPVINFLGRGC